MAPADPSEYAATFAVSYNLQEQLTHLLGGGPALNFTYDNLSVTAVGPEVGSAQGGTVVLVYTTGVFNTTTYLVSFGNDSSAVAATFLLQQRAVVCHPSVLPVASIPRLAACAPLHLVEPAAVGGE